MEKFLNRLLERENGIRDWLTQNNLEVFLKKADQILNSLPREDIKKAFNDEIVLALEHCAKNDQIKALDFQWYYSGDEIGGALAYGLDSCKTDGSIDGSDLGPDTLHGIELKLEHGTLVDDYFAEIPVDEAINKMVNSSILEEIEKSQESGSITNEVANDADDAITDYFQIWNYKMGYEVCKKLIESDIVQKLKNRAPFWVTMTRHDRSSVAIMLID